MKLKTYIRKFSGDTETPITLFYKYVGDKEGFILESRGEGKTNFSFLGKNPIAVLKGTNKLEITENGITTVKEGRLLDSVRDYIKRFEVESSLDIGFEGGAVGIIGYDIIKEYEKIKQLNPDNINTPTVHLMVFDHFIVYDHLHDIINLVVLDEINTKGESRAKKLLDKMENEIKSVVPDELYNITETNETKIYPNMTKKEYMDIVEKAKKYIYDGDIFQVVLSQRIKAETSQKPLNLYRKLRTINPSPYLYYFNFGDYQVAGSSPEMLVEVKKDRVYTCPIAGTRKRTKNADIDLLLASEMKNDPKEKAEHVMLVDLARNDMGRVCEIGSVKVSKFMNVHYYSHVMHLVSLVEGKKKKEHDSFSILSVFLPAGTLSGAPKIRAMEIIEELENEKRGVYGGSVGYFSFNGNMDMCIAIRTMVIKDKNVYMQAGAGIVADSLPNKEYEETLNKITALVKTIGGNI